jgi:hypothetical protein
MFLILLFKIIPPNIHYYHRPEDNDSQDEDMPQSNKDILLSPTISGGATGYAGYAPAYPAEPAASSIYILYNIVYTLYLYVKKKNEKTYLDTIT